MVPITMCRVQPVARVPPPGVKPHQARRIHSTAQTAAGITPAAVSHCIFTRLAEPECPLYSAGKCSRASV